MRHRAGQLRCRRLYTRPEFGLYNRTRLARGGSEGNSADPARGASPRWTTTFGTECERRVQDLPPVRTELGDPLSVFGRRRARTGRLPGGLPGTGPRAGPVQP